MREIEGFTLKDNETIVERFSVSVLHLRTPRRNYKSSGELILTTRRLVCTVNRFLGGPISCESSYANISAVLTNSDFSVYDGLAVYTQNGYAIHVDFFRNHMRALQLYLLIFYSLCEQSLSQKDALAALKKVRTDFCVPDDYQEVFTHAFLSNASDLGLVLRPNEAPYIRSPLEFQRYSSEEKSTDNEASLSPSAIFLDRFKASDRAYTIVEMFSKEGDYVGKGERIMRVELTTSPILDVNADRQGYIHWCDAECGSRYHTSEIVVKILDISRGEVRTKTAVKPIPSNSSKIQGHLDKLDQLIGLGNIKKEVRQLINLTQIQQERSELGMSTGPISRHMVFLGSPGTGKTTVARILGGLFNDLGVLSKGTFIETDRSGLVAGYLGQTALKTISVLKSALGGILFIDEAYSLSPSNGHEDQFGQEAVDTLLKFMEDNRDDIIIIVAGYSEPMDTFLGSNPGLRSRFNTLLKFQDYSDDELLELLYSTAKTQGYRIDPGAVDSVRALLSELKRRSDEHFSNGRAVRNLLEKSLKLQASRLISLPNRSKDDLALLIDKDFAFDDIESLGV